MIITGVATRRPNSTTASDSVPSAGFITGRGKRDEPAIAKNAQAATLRPRLLDVHNRVWRPGAEEDLAVNHPLAGGWLRRPPFPSGHRSPPHRPKALGQIHAEPGCRAELGDHLAILDEADCQIGRQVMRVARDHEPAHRAAGRDPSDIGDEMSCDTATLPRRVDEQVFQLKLHWTAGRDRRETNKMVVDEGDRGPAGGYT